MMDNDMGNVAKIPDTMILIGSILTNLDTWKHNYWDGNCQATYVSTTALCLLVLAVLEVKNTKTSISFIYFIYTLFQYSSTNPSQPIKW
jgi:hypothetical protein